MVHCVFLSFNFEIYVFLEFLITSFLVPQPTTLLTTDLCNGVKSQCMNVGLLTELVPRLRLMTYTHVERVKIVLQLLCFYVIIYLLNISNQVGFFFANIEMINVPPDKGGNSQHGSRI